MVRIVLYLLEDHLQGWMTSLGSLPQGYQPTAWGMDEREGQAYPWTSAQDPLAEADRSLYGFFLFCKHCTCNITRSRVNRQPYDIVTINPRRQKGVSAAMAEEILESAGAAGLAFGFAAEDEEYLHRNRGYFIRFGGDFETWVGRDLSRYLPGFYWITVISVNVADALGIDLKDVSSAFGLRSFAKAGSQFSTAKFFADPKDWRTHADTLDALCAKVSGVFCVRTARREARRFWTMKRTMRFLSETYP